MSTKSPAVAKSGAQRPKRLSVPRYSSSAGQEAVELAAEAGLFLDDWQAFVLTNALGERTDGRWAAGEVGLIVPRQNGKGSILEARELAGLFLFAEKLILHSAHEFKTAAEGFLRIKSLIDNHDAFRKRVKAIRSAHGDEGIELKNGARLRFVARSRGSGRGFSGDLVILDEAYALPDAAMDALMPTLSARPNPQIWYTSSAPLDDSEVLRRVCKRGRAGEDERLAYFEWCAEDDAENDDRDAWADANPSLGIRLSEEFTDRELGALSVEGFRRERLGIWSENESTNVLPNWAALADVKSEIPPGTALMFAVDVSPMRTQSTIAVAGSRVDQLRHVEIVDNASGVGWVVPRFRELRDKWGEIAVVVDPRSAAGSLVAELEAEEDITVYQTTTADVAVAAGRFYDAHMPEAGTLRHRNQAVLNTAVEGALTRTLGDAWTWDRRKPTADITPLVAVTLALWGLEEHGAFDISSQIF